MVNEQDSAMPTDLRRREALKTLASWTAAGAGAVQAPWVQAAGTFRIGLVSPQTGPLAVFAEPDGYVLDEVRRVLAKGLQVGGRQVAVEIVVKDSQSNSNRAAEVTSELILKHKVDIVLAAHTPETTNPVADTCELNGVPCVTCDTPWQPHFFGRGGDPKKGFEWTFHYFWGLEDVMASFASLWDRIGTNRTVGALWPNDPDGNAWGDPKNGFPRLTALRKLKFVDTGRFPSPADNFSAQIIEFKKQGVEIVSGVLPPPDFANFWAQAGQQGFKPKIVTVAKATEFPAAVNAIGARAEGLSVEVWWSPAFPFRSGLTGQPAAELARHYTQVTGRKWSMPLGFKHSLFEVAVAAYVKSGGGGAKALRDALRTGTFDTVAGQLNFAKGPVPNVSKTPLVAGQWKKQGKALELVVVDNVLASGVPLGGALEAIA